MVPPDWLEVFGNNVSGWDNPINHMMAKFYGNVQVHVTSRVHASVRAFIVGRQTLNNK